MPTILINTNLLKANSTNPYGLGDDQQQQQQQWQQQRQSESLDAEFRQELNAIINKLLIKSETVSFNFLLFIVYSFNLPKYLFSFSCCLVFVNLIWFSFDLKRIWYILPVVLVASSFFSS